MSDARIFENPRLAQCWEEGDVSTVSMPYPTSFPAGVKARVESDEALSEVRSAKNLASVDIVICTRLPDGTPAVLFSKRKPTEAFGGKWWMYGGSLGAYMSILAFIATRAAKECGVKVKPEVLVGVYLTCAGDQPQATLQPCYASRVPYDAISAKMRTDADHDAVRLFTLADLETIPENEQHWYPLRVAKLALEAMPL